MSSNDILFSLCPLIFTTTIPLFSSLPSLCVCVSPPPSGPSFRDSPQFCLRYQRDPHLKKPMVPHTCSTLACSSTNRPWPTCSFSSRLLSCRQVWLHPPTPTPPQLLTPCTTIEVALDRAMLYIYIDPIHEGSFITPKS